VFSIILLIVSSIIINVYLTQPSDSTFNAAQQVLLFVNSNLQALPIIQIKQISAGANCPSGMTKIPVGNWPGSKSGQVCKNGK